MRITDKMRLDWLENPKHVIYPKGNHEAEVWDGIAFHQAETIREAIDAAIRASRKEKTSDR